MDKSSGHVVLVSGGEILLRLSGCPKVERVLQLIDAIEALGIDPVDAAPDYWQPVHNRPSVNEAPRPYTRSRHQGWLPRLEQPCGDTSHDARGCRRRAVHDRGEIRDTRCMVRLGFVSFDFGLIHGKGHCRDHRQLSDSMSSSFF
jgi:hypothetical protein